MTALDIISQARERLGDKNEQRWSNDRMLAIVSQGQTDICIETGYLRKQTRLPLSTTSTSYPLPVDCDTVKRIEYKGDLLPFHTRSDQDISRVNTKSDFTAYKSNLNVDRVEIQPTLPELTLHIKYVKGDTSDDTITVTPLFGVVTSSDNASAIIGSDFGAITYITNDLDDNAISDGYGEIAGNENDLIEIDAPDGNFGVTTGVEFSSAKNKYGFITSVKGHEVSGRFGIIGSIAAEDDTVKVYYIAAPRKLKFINATLVLPSMWEGLLLHYVVGTALQDDNDANNIQRGELELNKYNTKLNKLKAKSSNDYSASASDKYETNYRRV